MIGSIWNFLLYQPLLNALVFLISIIPGGDVGIAVIILTILVKLVLFPLSQKGIKNQVAMNMMAPELDKIKKSGASKEEQGRLTLELYKKHKTNPFSGCLPQIATLIVILALYRVFIKGVDFNPALLYSFVHTPMHINVFFLGLIDITKTSFILAVLAAVSQYFQLHYMPQPPVSTSSDASANFGKNMTSYMKYTLPVFIFIILYTHILGITLSAAVALYFITNNLFTIVQQIYANKTEKKELDKEVEVLIKEN